jgi:tetratricopeptide (TPR) repeat protein
LEIDRNFETYTNVSVTRFYNRDYARSLEAAKQAIMLLAEEPPLLDHYLEWGNLADIEFWSPNGDRESAQIHYEKALELAESYLLEHPGHPESLRSKSWYLAMLQRHDEAVACINELLKDEDISIETSYKAALIFMQIGKRQDSIEYLKRSLEQGMSVRHAMNEPIFYQNSKINDLLSEFPIEEEPCP